MAREWQLYAPQAGPGVPADLVGEVRVVTHDAAWLRVDQGSVLLSAVGALVGPVTAGVAPPDGLAEGHRVRLSRGETWDVSPVSRPGERLDPDVPPVRLESDWLNERVIALSPTTSKGIGREIAGWGPGLTPSGDDVLIGYVYARSATGHANAAEIGDLIATMNDRSGEPALSLVRWAAQGHHFSMVQNALVALLTAVPADHPDLVLMDSLGQQTGRATLAGMMAALRAR